MRKVLMAAAILATCAWTTLAAPPTTETITAKTIEAENIVIKDSKGIIRIELKVDKDFPTITLFDTKGRATVFIGSGDYPVVAISDNNTEHSAIIVPESHVMTNIDHLILDAMAKFNVEGYISEKLIRTNFTLYYYPTSHPKLRIFVDTKTQPRWSHYRGNGSFDVSDRELKATYEEAVKPILDLIPWRSSFGLVDSDIEMVFTILGSEVAVWRNGALKLKGE